MLRVLSVQIFRSQAQRRVLGAFAVAASAALVVQPASAQTIIDDWAKIQVPPVPKIDPQQVDAKTTAVLVLDFINQICSDRTPRCVASVPKVAKLVTAARAAGSLVV